MTTKDIHELDSTEIWNSPDKHIPSRPSFIGNVQRFAIFGKDIKTKIGYGFLGGEKFEING